MSPMSESPSNRGVDPVGGRTVGSSVSPSREGRPPALDIVVVPRDDGPDRATIHPPGLTGVARMETWLSTDHSAVVDLSTWR
jgi:hypothetical protein